MNAPAPPPPSHDTGAHPALRDKGIAFPWKAVLASVASAVIIGGATGLLTWGNTTAQIEHQRNVVAELREEVRLEKERNRRAVRDLELSTARTDVTVDSVEQALDRMQSALERIEDKLDGGRRHRRRSTQ